MSARVAIQMANNAPSASELSLQEALGCSIAAATAEVENDFDFLLRWQDGALTLLATASDAPGGLCIDFTDRALQKRALDGLKRQGIGKAVGLKKKPLPEILDATAGLGGDAYLLASAGCQVTMLERSGIVHALLQDALRRASLLSDSQAAAAVKNLKLSHADFLDQPLAESSVDVVYLDPMFPADRKNARSGKGMYLLQELLGNDCEEEQMLAKARYVARNRVVVKRGKRSGWMAQVEPDISFRGSSSRFDVYLEFSEQK